MATITNAAPARQEHAVQTFLHDTSEEAAAAELEQHASAMAGILVSTPIGVMRACDAREAEVQVLGLARF